MEAQLAVAKQNVSVLKAEVDVAVHSSRSTLPLEFDDERYGAEHL